MGKVIVALGASNSKHSINKKLASFAAHQIADATVNLLDLNDFEMPIYSIDREQENGVHQLALDFKAHLKAADGIIISFAEHNGAYSAAFKNPPCFAACLLSAFSTPLLYNPNCLKYQL